MSKFVYFIIGAIILLAAAWFFFFKDTGGTEVGSFELETTAIERGEVAQIVSASGAVRALTTVEVGSQVSGQIVALNADFNSDVKEGDVIARIDPQTFETRVASSQADLSLIHI